MSEDQEYLTVETTRFSPRYAFFIKGVVLVFVLAVSIGAGFWGFPYAKAFFEVPSDPSVEKKSLPQLSSASSPVSLLPVVAQQQVEEPKEQIATASSADEVTSSAETEQPVVELNILAHESTTVKSVPVGQEEVLSSTEPSPDVAVVVQENALPVLPVVEAAVSQPASLPLCTHEVRNLFTQLMALHDTILAEKPFDVALDAVAVQIGQEDKQLRQLLYQLYPHAKEGVSSAIGLRYRFEHLKEKLERIERRPEPETWLAKVLSHFIRIYPKVPEEAVAPSAVDAIIVKLTKGNLHGARKATYGLRLESQKLLANWQKDAAIHVQAYKAWEQLNQAVIATTKRCAS